MADHVGIYEVLGKLMPSPTCKISPTSQITEKDVNVPDFRFVLSENKSVHHETVVYNAYFSGTEVIEDLPEGVPAAVRNLYYVKNPKFETYGQISAKSYEFTGSVTPEGRTEGMTTSSVEDAYAVFVDFSDRMSGVAKIESGVLYIPAVSPDPEASEGSDSTDAARVYNETIGVQTTVAQANDANAFLSRQDYTKTTEERWTEANQERTTADSLSIVEGSITDTTGGSDSSVRTQIYPSLTPVTLMNARSNRRGGSIYNGTTTPMYLSLGGVATTTSFSAKLYPDDLYELPAGWLGSVSGVWASIGTGQAQVIEYI